MHGIIFNQFNQFVVKTYGIFTWGRICDKLNSKSVHFPTQVYPDEEFFDIVQAAAAQMKIGKEELMISFGEFIAPSLIKVYSASIQPSWTIFDLVEHTENTMHKAVRWVDKLADPPKLVCQRVSVSEVVIDYSSRRKMVAFGVGIIKGLSKSYSEKLYTTRIDDANSSQLRIRRPLSPVR